MATPLEGSRAVGTTLKWAAPEVLKDETVRMESDVYSYGRHCCVGNNEQGSALERVGPAGAAGEGFDGKTARPTGGGIAYVNVVGSAVLDRVSRGPVVIRTGAGNIQ